MIKAESGRVQIDGTEKELKADFVCVVLALLRWIDEDILRSYIEIGINLSKVDALDSVINELSEGRKHDIIRN